MTLLDAPAYDAARAHRRRVMIWSGFTLLVVLFVADWLVSGMPVDWPWNWWTHLQGRITVNHFLDAIEHNDLQKAYGIWVHNPDWQKHPDTTGPYPFSRFENDWSPSSPNNDYGAIRSHKIAVARIVGNVLIVGIRINGLKSNALFLDYDPHTHSLGFAPVQLYLGP